MSDNLLGLTNSLSQLLLNRRLLLVTAESCTGGWIAQTLTSIAGSSKWFERGFVCYSNEAKSDMLDVSPELIGKYGAVSQEVARSLAAGAIKRSLAQVSIAVTGIAGPDGGSVHKPVGTVWFGWAHPVNGKTEVVTMHQLFAGDRQQIRHQAVEFAIKQLHNILSE